MKCMIVFLVHKAMMYRQNSRRLLGAARSKLCLQGTVRVSNMLRSGLPEQQVRRCMVQQATLRHERA